MNKRGQIHIKILVVGVLVICSLVLFSFFLKEGRDSSNLNLIYLIEEVNLVAEKKAFYEREGLDQSKIKEILEVDSRIKLTSNSILLEHQFNPFGGRNFSYRIEYFP